MWPKLWYHFTRSLCGCNHPGTATLATYGLGDVVPDGVHHDRSVPALLDTGLAHISPEEDDAEGVHHTLALTGTPPHVTGRRDVFVPEDAAGVAHALA